MFMYYKCAVIYIAVMATTVAATTANELFDAFVKHAVNREKKNSKCIQFYIKNLFCVGRYRVSLPPTCIMYIYIYIIDIFFFTSSKDL